MFLQWLQLDAGPAWDGTKSPRVLLNSPTCFRYLHRSQCILNAFVAVKSHEAVIPPSVFRGHSSEMLVMLRQDQTFGLDYTLTWDRELIHWMHPLLFKFFQSSCFNFLTVCFFYLHYFFPIHPDLNRHTLKTCSDLFWKMHYTCSSQLKVLKMFIILRWSSQLQLCNGIKKFPRNKTRDF